MLGTFIVVFFFLTQTEEKAVFSKEKAITCFIIASSYIGARALCGGIIVTRSGACLNPAIGFGTSFTMLFDWTNKYGIELIWLYAAVPFGGSIIAIIFYELIFRKT